VGHPLLCEINLGFGFDYEHYRGGGVLAGVETLPGVFHGVGGGGENYLAFVGAYEKEILFVVDDSSWEFSGHWRAIVAY